MTTSVGEKRNFCLMLSLPSGQELAQGLGLTPPSLEVQEMEFALVDAHWDILDQVGILDEVKESVEWVVEVLDTTAPPGEKPTKKELHSTNSVLLSYGVALIQKLLEKQMIVILAHEEWSPDE